MLQVVRYNVGPLDNNTYVVVDEDSGRAVLVDPSFDSQSIWPEIEERGWSISEILNTHAHIDHVVENAFFAGRTGAPLALHPDDLPLLRALSEQAAWIGMDVPAYVEPARMLADGDTIRVGSESLTVVHTPGHSPGHVTFLGEGFAIVGDVLFAGSIGRYDLPGGNMETLLESIRKHLLVLPDKTIVYPGHGPETTIGTERSTNPFLANV